MANVVVQYRCPRGHAYSETITDGGLADRMGGLVGCSKCSDLGVWPPENVTVVSRRAQAQVTASTLAAKFGAETAAEIIQAAMREELGFVKRYLGEGAALSAFVPGGLGPAVALTWVAVRGTAHGLTLIFQD